MYAANLIPASIILLFV